ncbi:hypothetical protein ACU21_05900 [Actinobaculum suis]|nr:hypothetical protein ACU19_04480 [Actinobaculum suis]OCA94722.1 hypothetical protein ACU21_05900 [Actinobaculum suis]OCA95548.1 hypothetical protein ACU20_04010 [Actinobaculum suis]
MPVKTSRGAFRILRYYLCNILRDAAPLRKCEAERKTRNRFSADAAHRGKLCVERKAYLRRR